MDSTVTVRYFQLQQIGDNPLSFEEAIEAAMRAGPTARRRVRQISPGVWVRLERRRRRDGFITGEVVREQRENIPPEVREDGLVPLAVGGLGHSIAFAFDPESSVIAVQFDPRGVSLGRFMEYLRSINPRARFKYDAVVNNDAWDRFLRGEPRSLEFSIASPQNLDEVGGEGSVLAISKRLAEISDAPVVSVHVSMGRTRRTNLNRGFVAGALRLLTAGDAAERASTLKVKMKQDGLPSDEIDFINDFAKDKEVIVLPSGDHDEHYRRRSAFVIRSFLARLNDIRNVYA